MRLMSSVERPSEKGLLNQVSMIRINKRIMYTVVSEANIRMSIPIGSSRSMSILKGSSLVESLLFSKIEIDYI